MMAILKIFCIWISCIICLFGRLQFPIKVVGALEYYDDHEQLSYELDTEQSKAKYDSRLLSQQLAKEQPKPLEDHPDMQIAKDGTSYHADSDDNGSTESENGNGNADDDMQPHGRAASCHNGGRTYTHGQKVARYDPCEVCLCMDGEIFCWWEKCSKKPQIVTTEKPIESSQVDPYFPGNYETTTIRLKAVKQKTNKFSNLNGNLFRISTRKMKNPKIYKNLLQQQQQKQEEEEEENGSNNEQKQQEPPHFYHHNDESNDENDYGGRAAASENSRKESIEHRKYHTKQQKQQQQQILTNKDHQRQQQEQQQIPMQQNHGELHHNHHHKSSNGNYEHASAKANKILNFPENLPSVLYSDYKTEEHEHLQHQHHQQHLKHQLLQQLKKKKQQQKQQKQQQQREAKMQRQLQQQQQLERKLQQKNSDEGDENFDIMDEILFKEINPSLPPILSTLATSFPSFPSSSSYLSLQSTKTFSSPLGFGVSLSSSSSSSSGATVLPNSGADSYYDEAGTDSDILPVPPTKKPKLSTSSTKETAPNAGDHSSDSITIKPNRIQNEIINDEVNNKSNESEKKMNGMVITTENNGATETVADGGNDGATRAGEDDGADDAFHRWLTSNDTDNNKSQIYDEKFLDRSNNKTIHIIYTTLPSSKAATTIVESGGRAEVDGEKEDLLQLNEQLQSKPGVNVAGASVVAVASSLPAISFRATSSSDGTEVVPSLTMLETSSVTSFTSVGDSNSMTDSHNGSNFNNIINQNRCCNIQNNVINNNYNQPDYINDNSFPYNNNNNNNNNNSNSNNNNNIKMPQNGGDAILRSTLNEYNNGSLINIDISLVTTEEDQRQQQQKQQQQEEQQHHNLQQQQQQQSNNNNKTATVSHDGLRNGDSSFAPSWVSGSAINTTATLARAAAATTATRNGSITTTTVIHSTTSSPIKQCNVMGTLYNIGDVLPQDTGNCLQCVCSESYTKDDTPRVTCSPHNCPPLVLPDLLDATGY